MTIEKLIELKNFNLTYDNEKSFVFKNANFDINKIDGGNITAMIGESGCGKSTILRFISNLQKPSSGEIKICDGQVGMIFQKYSSLEWYTVYQNVMLGLKNVKLSKKEKHDKVMEMLDLVGLKEHKDKFAQYPTLSGGQLQRVAIARSLIQQPKLLLMDEPFGALDIGTRLKMQELLLDIRKKTGTSIVLVTHDIKEAVYLADNIYLIGQEGIKERIYVPFSRIDRNRQLIRRQEFVNMVYEIEDKLIRR